MTSTEGGGLVDEIKPALQLSHIYTDTRSQITQPFLRGWYISQSKNTVSCPAQSMVNSKAVHCKAKTKISASHQTMKHPHYFLF